MKHSALVLMSMFFLAMGGMSAGAQQPPGTAQQETHEHDADQGRSSAAKQRGEMGCGMMHEMMGAGMMGHRGMMGGGPLALRIIFALMDSDGDGTVSLQEFQAAHEKIFKAMDADKDGTLTPEEMQAFMHGSRGSR